MAQAQIALEGGRAPTRALLRMVALAARLRARRQDRRTLARLSAEREVGRATGARL